MNRYVARLQSGADVETLAKSFKDAIENLRLHYLSEVVAITRKEAATVRWMKRDPGAQIPTRANPRDAGFDLYANERVEIWVGGQAIIGTGVSVELPEGYAGFIWPRSGLATRHMLNVHAGLIDTGYRGEIKVCLINHGGARVEIKKGDRIAQLVVGPYITASETVTSLSDSQRGEKGFGSSGV